MVSLQVPTLAYVSECEPEVQTVYESLICNEFLEVRREAPVHRPDQHETAHLSGMLGTRQAIGLPEDGNAFMASSVGSALSTIMAMLGLLTPAMHQLGWTSHCDVSASGLGDVRGAPGAAAPASGGEGAGAHHHGPLQHPLCAPLLPHPGQVNSVGTPCLLNMIHACHGACLRA